MTYVQNELEQELSFKRERFVAGTFILAITGFMFFDILDDWIQGIPMHHLVPEALIAVFGMGTFAFLFVRFIKSRHTALGRAREEVAKAKKLASDWQGQVVTLRKGLSEAINKQLEVWQMTEAEQDICYMLLKGFSLQEIADLRNTSERTVRQQSSVIYRKSGLSGRVQLAAFFLEDLLVPEK